MKRVKLLSLIMVFILVFSMAAFASEASTSKTVYIIHTNDVHSRVTDSAGMGYAKVAGLAASIKTEKGTEPILVDAGDALHGQTIATLEQGESIVNIMNKVGYHVMTPGNHDFNYGKDRLMELKEKATFEIISANIKREDGTTLLAPWTIIERDGVKIAFFGLSTPETAYKTNPKNVTGLTFDDPVKTAENMVKELSGKADVIVCVSHLGLDESSEITSKLVAERVEGIDLIIDGHSHTQLTEPLKVGNTLIVQTGEYLNNVGLVEINLDSKNAVTGIKAELKSKEQVADISADEGVTAAIESYNKSQKAILDEVIAISDIHFDGERQNVRTGPTNLACLITTAMVEATGADLAITNGGGIRASIEPGEITRGDIVTVLPFGNYIVTKKMKGSDILAALEHGLSQYPNPNGGHPQVANVEYFFDATKPAGQRLVYVKIKGEKLDPAKEYIVATNDFMAAGGDGYPFQDLPLVNEFQALDEAVIEYITNHPEKLKYTTYVIQPGDALWKIAKKTGHFWLEIANINNLENPDLIYAGDKLLIPAW